MKTSRNHTGGSAPLAGVSLALPEQGVVALVGPNGAGKTSLFDAWTGWLRPDAGHCYFDGRDITRLPPYRIARLGLARTFQDLRLVAAVPALKNVMLARSNQRRGTRPTGTARGGRRPARGGEP